MTSGGIHTPHHHYHSALSALNVESLGLEPGATKAGGWEGDGSQRQATWL